MNARGQFDRIVPGFIPAESFPWLDVLPEFAIIGFEQPLLGGRPDVQVAVDRADGELLSSLPLGALAVWLKQWPDEVRNVWLEFDACRPLAPAAGVLLELSRTDGNGPFEDGTWWGRLCLHALFGAAPLPAVASNIARMVRELPEGGYVYCVGAMLQRGGTAIRLVLDLGPGGGRSPSSVLRAFLERIEWPDDRAKAEAIVATLGPFGIRLFYNFDVADNVLPILGIEGHVSNSVQIGASDDQWTRMCSFTCDRGWGDPTVTATWRRWNENQQMTLRGRPATALLRVHHVKLTLAAADVRAKAYAGARIIPMDGSSPSSSWP